MSILVCGGAGYIGSHINKELNRQGYDTVVFDNLVYGHKEAVKWGELVVGDLKNTADLEGVFDSHPITLANKTCQMNHDMVYRFYENNKPCKC